MTGHQDRSPVMAAMRYILLITGYASYITYYNVTKKNNFGQKTHGISCLACRPVLTSTECACMYSVRGLPPVCTRVHGCQRNENAYTNIQMT